MELYFSTGRNDQIWTDDPFHPKEVRYQAALRPERLNYYNDFLSFSQHFIYANKHKYRI